MANLYVRSTDGSDADDGSTWALAKATLAGAAAIDAAGDSIYPSQAHSESSAAAQSIALAGTIAAPTRVIAANDAAAPPTAVSTATVATTGANSITITGNAYLYGIIFSNGDGSTSSNFLINKTPGNTVMRFENCSLRLGHTNVGGRIDIGADSTINCMLTELVNTTLRFQSTSQRVVFGGTLLISGGGLAAGSSAITAFLESRSQRGTRALIENFDLSTAATGVVLLQGGTAIGTGSEITFRNMKLPTSWSGSLLSAPLTVPGTRVSMFNCDAGDVNYALWIEDYCGSIRHETTVVRTGGSSDGTTTLAWKMTTFADVEYPLHVLRSPELGDWIDSVGAAKTLTVEILHDSVTALTDAEVWLEVEYLGTNGFPLGVKISDAKADVLATAANQTSSSETWTTTGITNVNKQKLSVTFTPQEKGFFIARVCVGKPSYTVYVDPEVTVS